MTTKLNVRINEGETVGFKVTLFDSNSDVIVPSSMDWYLYDASNTGVSSGAVSALSSENLITIGASLTLINTTQYRSEEPRLLYVAAQYTDSVLGTCKTTDVFQFTLVNNPYLY